MAFFFFVDFKDLKSLISGQLNQMEFGMIENMTQALTKAAAAIAAGDAGSFTTFAEEALCRFAPSAPAVRPVDQALCFQGLLELGRGLGRFDDLTSANNFFVTLADLLPKKAQEQRQQIASARLDVFEAAVERGSSNFRMMAFMIDPHMIDVRALPKADRQRAIVSLFDLTERLIDLKGDIDTDGRAKHEPLAMAATVLEAYALQEAQHQEAQHNDEMIPVYLYANAAKENASFLVKGISPVDFIKVRPVAKHSVATLKAALTPDAQLMEAFAKLSGTQLPRTQFYDVVFGYGAAQRSPKKGTPAP